MKTVKEIIADAEKNGTAEEAFNKLRMDEMKQLYTLSEDAFELISNAYLYGFTKGVKKRVRASH